MSCHATVLITAGPEGTSAAHGIERACALGTSGKSAHLFFYGRGVRCLTEANLSALRAAGVAVYACFESLRRHGVGADPDSVTLCGLITLAGLIEASDSLDSYT